MGAILKGLISVVASNGVSRISKTKIAANIGGINAFFALIPGVWERDPTAIGQMLLLIAAWVGTLWGRGNSG